MDVVFFGAECEDWRDMRGASYRCKEVRRCNAEFVSVRFAVSLEEADEDVVREE